MRVRRNGEQRLQNRHKNKAVPILLTRKNGTAFNFEVGSNSRAVA